MSYRRKKKRKRNGKRSCHFHSDIDSLFVKGVIDVDTYYLYLQEYSRQIRRNGFAFKAVGTLHDGKQGYRFTKYRESRRRIPCEIPCYYCYADQRKWLHNGNICYWEGGRFVTDGKTCSVATSKPWLQRINDYAVSDDLKDYLPSNEDCLDSILRQIEG